MINVLVLPPIVGTEPFCNIGRLSVNGQVVLTTAQLAEFYGTTEHNITKNFNDAKSRFIEGKHFFKLESEDLKEFKNYVTKSDSVNFQISPRTPSLYLWTKGGILHHCKMLNTDKAWEVFELMEDTFFKFLETGSYSFANAINPFPPELSARWAEIKTRENEVKAADVLAKAARLTSSSKFREHLLKQANLMITGAEFVEDERYCIECD